MGKSGQKNRQENQSVEGPDGDSFEAGIASVFEAIQASIEGVGPRERDAGPVDSGATFQILGELNRLWANPAPDQGF